MKKLLLISTLFLLFSCKKEEQKPPISTEAKKENVLENSSNNEILVSEKEAYKRKKIALKDTLDISYYPNNKVKEILLSEYKGDKDVKLFYSESGLITEKITNFNNYPQHNFEYQNSKLIHQWSVGDIGGCIAITGKEFYWNKKGDLINEIIHSNFGIACSEKILIREIREFFEGTKNLKSTKFIKESYEGSNECPCGNWKEYDKNGTLINEQQFTDCTSLVSCDEEVEKE